MKPPTEKLHKAALLAVACKTILLGVCDDLKETTLYKQATKQKVNSLTDELEKFVSQMYKGISEDEGQQFNALVRTVESAAYLMASMSPSEIDQLNALLLSYKNGEVYVASTDKQMENMINQKRVKRIEPAA